MTQMIAHTIVVVSGKKAESVKCSMCGKTNPTFTEIDTKNDSILLCPKCIDDLNDGAQLFDALFEASLDKGCSAA